MAAKEEKKNYCELGLQKVYRCSAIGTKDVLSCKHSALRADELMCDFLQAIGCYCLNRAACKEAEMKEKSAVEKTERLITTEEVVAEYIALAKENSVKATKEESSCCENCKYSKSYGVDYPNIVTCHRHAPRSNIKNSDVNWPQLSSSDYCGEWKGK